METLVTIGYIIACLLLFSLAIAIHEFGHFIVALKLGLKVEAFSIGFGPAIWKKRWKGVEYRIGSIPLGGYVLIPSVDPEGTQALEGGSKEKSPKEDIPAWKELLVSVAGPLMNVVLAVVLAFVLAAVPGANFGVLPAEIGSVIEGGPAEAAGLKAGDLVLKVGGREVASWSEMQTEVQIAGGKPVPVEVLRGEEKLELEVVPEQSEVTGAWYIKALSVRKENMAMAWMPDRNPLRQLAWDATSIFRVLKGLVTPKEAKATSEALGGPVMIAEAIYGSMRRNVWDGIGFLRFLNVNLAVLNLLPIPVLDGGLILFALLAMVFRRKVPEVVVKYLSMTFMAILMGLMAILVLRDAWRSYRIHTYDHKRTDQSAEVR